MTVVIAARFSEESGAVLTDGMSVKHHTPAEIVSLEDNKLGKFVTPNYVAAVWGSSGVSRIFIPTDLELHKLGKTAVADFNALYCGLRWAFERGYEDAVNEIIAQQLQIPKSSVQYARKSSSADSERVRVAAQQILENGHSELQAELVGITYTEGLVRLFSGTQPDRLVRLDASHAYSVAGSGSEGALKGMAHLERNTEFIPEDTGLDALFLGFYTAKQECSYVGGQPLLATLKGTQICTYDANTTRMGLEVSLAGKWGQVAFPVVRKLHHRLFSECASVHQVNRELFSAASDPEELSFLLRGYDCKSIC
jgi:hypothetical protein